MTELTKTFACRMTTEERDYLMGEAEKTGRTASQVMRRLIRDQFTATDLLNPANRAEAAYPDDHPILQPIIMGGAGRAVNDNRPLVAKIITPIVRRDRIKGLEALEITKGLFEQIHSPEITHENHDECLERAEVHAVGYVLLEETIWIIVLEDGRFWKWLLAVVEEWAAALEEQPWLRDLPQLFLV